MPRVRFSQYLQRFVAAPDCAAEGTTVREALESVFAAHGALRGYVLEDQGELRRHVAIFVNGQQIRDRARQSDAIQPDDEILVLQALSGG